VEGGRYVHATHKETNMGYFFNIWKKRYVGNEDHKSIWLHEYYKICEPFFWELQMGAFKLVTTCHNLKLMSEVAP